MSRPPAGRKSLTYFNRDPRATLQEVTFDLPEVRRIFFGSFHKVLESPGRTTACAFLPDTLSAPRFWDRPPLGSAGHRLPCHHGTPQNAGTFLCPGCPHPNLGQRASSPCSWSRSPWEGPWWVSLYRTKLRPCEGVQEMWGGQDPDASPGNGPCPSLLWWLPMSCS